MRAIEQAAIDSGEVTGLELMERAGRGVVEAIFEWRPDLLEGERSAVVLCGPGNNGGDGLVVARLLKERGWAVEVFLYGDEAKLPPDAAENARRWRGIGEIAPLNEYTGPTREFSDVHDDQGNYLHLGNKIPFDLIIDAIFGIGLRRPISSDLHEPLGIMNLYPSEVLLPQSVVAIDGVSGFDLDSGSFLGTARLKHGHVYTRAGLTVTFHGPKIGHFLDRGEETHGKLAVVDIGLGKGAALMPKDVTKLIDFEERDGQVWKVHNLDKTGFWRHRQHKYSHGHALVLSSGMGRSGAARLAARAALRIGAGVVTVAAPADAVPECAAQLTAIMLREVGRIEGLAAMLSDERINAVCLRPGLGVGAQTRELVAVACAVEGGPGSRPGRVRNRSVALDADALTSFADDPPALFALLHDRCVLTPHEGEFGRLFPKILEKLHATATIGPAYSKVDTTREAAARAGCVVLFKGADTVIAAPSGRCAINSAHYERAAPWLATAGSGDVLAGMITGLLARGLDPMSAAESAAWLHVEVGRHLGPGLIAEDIPEALPDILKQVLGWKPPPCDEDA